MRAVVIVIMWCGVLACGGAAGTSPEPATPVAFPLPPSSPTVIGALLGAADALGLEGAQRERLAALDEPVRARFEMLVRERELLAEEGMPRRGPPPGGVPPGRGGGRRGGGGMGGPGGGMGGPGGGMGGPGGGEVPKPPRAPLDPEAEREKRRELRARIDAIQTELETSQREPATAALAELLPDQQAAAEAIIADFFASLQAPAVPPGGPGGPRGPGGRIEGEPVEGVPVP